MNLTSQTEAYAMFGRVAEPGRVYLRYIPILIFSAPSRFYHFPSSFWFRGFGSPRRFLKDLSSFLYSKQRQAWRPFLFIVSVDHMTKTSQNMSKIDLIPRFPRPGRDHGKLQQTFACAPENVHQSLNLPFSNFISILLLKLLKTTIRLPITAQKN